MWDANKYITNKIDIAKNKQVSDKPTQAILLLSFYLSFHPNHSLIYGDSTF